MCEIRGSLGTFRPRRSVFPRIWSGTGRPSRHTRSYICWHKAGRHRSSMKGSPSICRSGSGSSRAGPTIGARSTPRLGIGASGKTSAFERSLWRKPRCVGDGRRAPSAAYSLAGSFVKWLIEIRLGGDLDRFMNDIYRSGDLQAATGETAPALEWAWTQTLDDQ